MNMEAEQAKALAKAKMDYKLDNMKSFAMRWRLHELTSGTDEERNSLWRYQMRCARLRASVSDEEEEQEKEKWKAALPGFRIGEEL
uniref:Uncharacterized protein n=1 Tax=Pristionchus pacificus TaxID=54126 RepID=A0A2A6CXF5_PRIPA|eukprot:PDM82713.1 hypothetical protein PRIPAC_37106 [Pristionchus pacificus]